ncbi:MAG: hypothetical protein JO257_02620 [Deltaproteobacteria bacterium]|nr:hypothetical protein [Deltaproteobacteria bacterium]
MRRVGFVVLWACACSSHAKSPGGGAGDAAGGDGVTSVCAGGAAIPVSSSTAAWTPRAHGPTGDYDGDRFADYVDLHPSTGQYWIHLNKRDGSFAGAGMNYASGQVQAEDRWEILVGDFDGDGLTDVGDRELATGDVTVRLNAGDGTFAATAAAMAHTSSGGAWEELVGDFNGDRRADLADHDLTTGAFYIRLNCGDGTFAGASAGGGTLAVGPRWEALVGDFTGDGYTDFADHNLDDGTLYVHENLHDGSFASATWGTATTAHGAAWETLVGDFTGDGFTDYADHDLASGQFFVHENRKDGTFAPSGTDWGHGQTSAGADWEVMGYRIQRPFAQNGRPCAYYGAQCEDASLAHTNAAGIGSLRINLRIAGHATWDAAAFAPYDQEIAAAARDQIEVVALVNNEAIANAGQGTWNAPPTTSDGRNAYVQMYVDAITALMQRYGDTVKYWEIWNEPNACSSDYLSVCNQNPQTAGGSFIRADILAKIMAETYVQNRDLIVAKDLHLGFGGIYAHDVNGAYAATDYIAEAMDNGVWTWFQQHYGRAFAWDFFAFHIYTTLQPGAPPVSRATIDSFLDDLASTRTARGDHSPVFITEYGYPTPQLSEALQGTDIDTTLSAFEARGEIARTYVFRITEWGPSAQVHWGIYRGDGTAKPAVDVYRRHAAGCTR